MHVTSSSVPECIDCIGRFAGAHTLGDGADCVLLGYARDLHDCLFVRLRQRDLPGHQEIDAQPAGPGLCVPCPHASSDGVIPMTRHRMCIDSVALGRAYLSPAPLRMHGLV